MEMIRQKKASCRPKRLHEYKAGGKKKKLLQGTGYLNWWHQKSEHKLVFFQKFVRSWEKLDTDV